MRRAPGRPRALVAWVVALLGAAGCAHPPAARVPTGTVGAADLASLPRSEDEARGRRQAGRRYDECDIRRHYNALLGDIAPEVARLAAAGRGAEEQARAAYAIRRAARLTARAMMERAEDVEALRARDREKYGDPDGPTFDYLVDKARRRGLAGDPLYADIVASAQRTDDSHNAACGIDRR